MIHRYPSRVKLSIEWLQQRLIQVEGYLKVADNDDDYRHWYGVKIAIQTQIKNIKP